MSAGRILVIIATFLYLGVMLGYETWALLTNDVTISRMVWTFVAGKPWLSAILCIGLLSAFGMLMGHFFWSGTHR